MASRRNRKVAISSAIGLALALIATSLLAANLGQYKDWPDSPQGYFMTKTERADWAKLTSEAEAEQFVNKFVASRGPRFTDDVAAAAKEADDHLSVGVKKGSRTLRGKIVILLGPPKSFSIERSSGDKSATMASHVSPWRPQNVQAPSNTAPLSEMRKRYPNDYKFTYDGRVIVVAVNPTTGDDRILDARVAREVDELLEAAAESRRVNR
jgi:GWxTD domain-containing protein